MRMESNKKGRAKKSSEKSKCDVKKVEVVLFQEKKKNFSLLNVFSAWIIQKLCLIVGKSKEICRLGKQLTF